MKPLVSSFLFLLFFITGIFGNVSYKQHPVAVYAPGSCIEKTHSVGGSAIKPCINADNTANDLSYFGEDDEQEETLRSANTSRYWIACLYLSFYKSNNCFTKHARLFCKTTYIPAAPIYLRHRAFRI